MPFALSPIVFALSLSGGAPPPPSEAAINQPAKPPNKQPQAEHPRSSSLGFTLGGGITSGIGIGVRKHFDNRWGFHATGIPLLGKHQQFVALGVQGMYSFYRGRIARLYGLFGVQGIYSTEGYPEGPRQRMKYYEKLLHTSFGPGIGLELHFNQRISWALELPIAGVVTRDLKPQKTDSGFQVLPVPNSAITIYY